MNFLERRFSSSFGGGQSLQNVEKAGWLTKQGGVVKNWKRRWCVLTKDAKFLYYKAKDDKVPAGEVILENFSVQTAFNKTGKKNSFELSTKERVFFMVADTQNEADEWVGALTKASRSIKKSAAVVLPLPQGDKIKLMIHGMMCPHCEEKVKSVLSTIQGVISFEIKEDELSVEGKLDHNAYTKLISSLEDAGFIVATV